MSSDFAIFKQLEGQLTAVRISQITSISAPAPRPRVDDSDPYTYINLGQDAYITVRGAFDDVMQQIQGEASIPMPPPAQLIPCGPMPLGITIEQLGSVIAELTPMLEAIVQAKHV